MLFIIHWGAKSSQPNLFSKIWPNIKFGRNLASLKTFHHCLICMQPYKHKPFFSTLSFWKFKLFDQLCLMLLPKSLEHNGFVCLFAINWSCWWPFLCCHFSPYGLYIWRAKWICRNVMVNDNNMKNVRKSSTV